MTVTLNDVARRAGVSKSTVSNVVRGAAPVAPSTRRRVEGAISELGYRPNEVARALKQRSTQTLGLVITDTVNPFAASLAQAVVRRARRDGYAVLIADTDGDPQIEAAQVRALVARRVDGVIFAALTEGSTNLGDLLDREVPTVLASFGGGLDRRAGAIDIDEEEAMDNVVQYLADLGHERIAFARQHAREADVDRRPNAFSKAMRKREPAGGLARGRADCDLLHERRRRNRSDGLARTQRPPRARGRLGRRLRRRAARLPPSHPPDDRAPGRRDDRARARPRCCSSAVAEGRPVERRELLRGELIVRESTGPRRA